MVYVGLSKVKSTRISLKYQSLHTLEFQLSTRRNISIEWDSHGSLTCKTTVIVGIHSVWKWKALFGPLFLAVACLTGMANELVQGFGILKMLLLFACRLSALIPSRGPVVMRLVTWDTEVGVYSLRLLHCHRVSEPDNASMYNLCVMTYSVLFFGKISESHQRNWLLNSPRITWTCRLSSEGIMNDIVSAMLKLELRVRAPSPKIGGRSTNKGEERWSRRTTA